MMNPHFPTYQRILDDAFNRGFQVGLMGAPNAYEIGAEADASMLRHIEALKQAMKKQGITPIE